MVMEKAHTVSHQNSPLSHGALLFKKTKNTPHNSMTRGTRRSGRSGRWRRASPEASRAAPGASILLFSLYWFRFVWVVFFSSRLARLNREGELRHIQPTTPGERRALRRAPSSQVVALTLISSSRERNEVREFNVLRNEVREFNVLTSF